MPVRLAIVAVLLAGLPAWAAPRPPWTTSRVAGTPEPPPPYVIEDAFPRLRFHRPVEVVSAPGSDRLFVAELEGKIWSFPARRDVERADLFADLAPHVPRLAAVYGLVFHPDFARNRTVFVMYALRSGLQDGSRVSRFRVRAADPPVLDPGSETVLLTWYAGGHNGGSLQFGPDGYLYVSTGDGTDPYPPDRFDVGQTLDDLLSAVLRIDVDRAEGGRPYAIPPDNPFRGTAGARPEIWAYGFRNPWRMAIDRATGELWLGDVGWETWEMIHRVERGGNYGWSVMEGPMKLRPEAKAGPTPILPPVMVHRHTEARSITGGQVYRGRALPELAGAYVYGDFETGRVWGLRYDAAARQVTWHRELADTRRNLVAFGLDPAGELLLLDYGGATSARSFAAAALYRLVPNPAGGANQRFPRTLSETGIFRAARAHALAPGVVPYRIAAEPWADGARAERFVALPGRARVAVERGRWRFPAGAVLGKTLSIGARRVETQILHFDGALWRPYSYRWREDGRDADLVGAGGEDVAVTWTGSAGGEARRQTWRFASRSECSTCHNVWSGPVLGFVAPQLAQGEQLRALVDGGVLAAPPPEPFPRLHDPYDDDGPLEARARSWLHVNCAHCHRFGAGGMAALQLPFDLELGRTETVGARPTQGTFGLEGAALIVPGAPDRSVLFYRLATVGGGRMPRIGARAPDPRGLDLVERWIRRLPRPAGDQAPAAEEASTAARRLAGAGPDAAGPLVERLLGSASGALLLARAIDHGTLAAEAGAAAIARGVAHARGEIRGLFERFLPEEARAARLGEAIAPQQILSLAGDPERGRRLFLQGGAGCLACHRVGREGGALGPALDGIGARYGRADILTHILEPSRQIDPRYVWYVAETTDGEVHAGLLAERTEREIALLDAQGAITRLPAGKVKGLDAQTRSIMPELLLSALTAQEAADLIEFLASLR